MNIVYRLKNLNKETGTRFYIGSKIDCDAILVNGINTIIGTANKPYYGSSQSLAMSNDLAAGHIFEAEILEKVKDRRRKAMFAAERKWMEHFNAVESEDYYNLAYPFDLTRKKPNYENAVCNKYGELLKKFAKNQSACSNRDAQARKIGFKNFGEQAFYLQDCIDRGENGVDVGKRFGTHRHRLWSTLEPFDMKKAKLELENGSAHVEKIRECIMNGASVYKTAEVLGLEIPTVRFLLDDFDTVGMRSFYAAKKLGKTKNELELEITKLVLDGMSFTQIAKLTGLTSTSVRRYFMRFIRSRLKSSDFS